MKKDYTDITILLDRSGSMESIKDDTIGGLKLFTEEQAKLPGKCLLTLIQFDSESYDVILKEKPIGEVSGISLNPRGWTPLLDSVGKAINETGERLKVMDEDKRPEFVVFVIVTDGQENASHEFTKDTIKKMIVHQTDVYHWKFTYLGANQDAFEEADKIGIAQGSTLDYAADPKGVKNMYNSLAVATSCLRSRVEDNMSYSAEDRKKQKR
jgi:hypothetical protein